MSRFNKQKTIKEIVKNFNDYQSHDSYWFPKSGIQIEWSRHQEVYLILHEDKTWDYAGPQHLEMYVEDLHVEDLKEYAKR